VLLGLSEDDVYAVIETGGKQYKVSVGQSVDVGKLPGGIGETVDIEKVLLLADDSEVVVGRPTVDGARVRTTVLEQGRHPKLVVFKFRSGNRYQRKGGHRQGYTRLRIEEIVREGEEKKRSAAVKRREPEIVAERTPVAIDELDLPSRVIGALRTAGIEDVEDLLSKSDEELLSIRGFGAKALEQVRTSLKARGLIEG
jgi:large subunit ribosomal protein L21